MARTELGNPPAGTSRLMSVGVGVEFPSGSWTSALSRAEPSMPRAISICDAERLNLARGGF